MDMFTYGDPYYYRNQQQRLVAGERMSFVESIFSFVFGDGDPNVGFEEERWRKLGKRLQVRGFCFYKKEKGGRGGLSRSPAPQLPIFPV